MLIVAETKVAEAIQRHPELKDVLMGLSPKFKILDNPAVFKTVGRFARMKDVARLGNLSICEVLYPLNEALGQLDAMAEACPECMREQPAEDVDEAGLLVAAESRTEKSTAQEPGDPEGSHQKHPAWWPQRESYPVFDVRNFDEDPFHFVMKKASGIPVGEGFGILQSFRPDPLLNVLEAQGFENFVERESEELYRVWFHRIREGARPRRDADSRVGVVLQSATPVVWPILARLMASERLRRRVRFEETKVWEKTEQHLAWMMNGRADVSFSAVVAATRFFARGVDLKMASIDVWDNFFILSRGEPIRSLSDLKGRTLHVPLIRNAPPFAVLSYLLKAEGLDPSELDFAFGAPFGRADEIAEGFVSGRYDAVLLREPEASMALAGAGSEAFDPLALGEVWERHHGEGAMLPNAGLVFKGEFVRRHPEEARLIVEEVASAIDWVRAHPLEAADLAVEHMDLEQRTAELFVSRVTFHHVPAPSARDLVRPYLRVLAEHGGIRLRTSQVEEALGIFDLPFDVGSGQATTKEEKILRAIEKVEHPEIAMTLVDLGMVRDIRISPDGHVSMALVIPFLGIPEVIRNYLGSSLVQAVRDAGGEVDEIRIQVMTDEERQAFFQKERAHWRL